MIARADVSGLILAGGQGRRMQRPDAAQQEKALLTLHGRPLVQWAASAMPAGLAQMYISANRCHDVYKQYGTVVPDDPELGVALGPLAGVLSVLQCVTTPWLYVAPADVPQPPCGIFECLLKFVSVQSLACGLVYARTDLPQPLFMLVHVCMLDNLRQYLLAGNRQVQRWQHDNGQAVQLQGDNNEFFNINTPEDLCLAHQIIHP